MSTDLNPLFSKGINKHFHLKYELHPSKLDTIFHMDTMDGRYTDEQMWEKYQLPGQRSPGNAWRRGELKPSYSKRFVPVNYALGDVIAQEDWDDDQYGVLSRLLPAKGGALADAHAVLKERVAADFFKNIAFAAAGNNVAGMADGRPLFDTAHPVSLANSSVTYANRPSTEVDLSISAYQAGATNLMQQFAPNDTEIIANRPRILVINPDQRYVAKQILKGEWERGTTDRNKNFITDDNVRLVEWPYFRTSGSTGTRNAWFLVGDTHYLRFMTRQDVRIKTDYDITTLAYVFVSYCRFVVGASDWRGVYGSKGV